MKFARPCLTCNELIPAGQRCPKCGTTEARGYGSSWRRLSQQVIAEEGRCRDCGTTGTAKNPLTCDHIVAKANGGTDDRSNLCCRCRRHNSSKGVRVA